MKTEFIISYFCRITSAASMLIVTPLYLAVTGVDGFAVVSFSLIVVTIFSFLDGTAAAILTREFARPETGEPSAIQVYTLLELIYVALLAISFAAALVYGDAIATQYVKVANYGKAVIHLCVVLMVLEAATQALVRFYLSACLALNRTNVYNLVSLIWMVGKHIAALAMFHYFGHIVYLFVTYLVITLAFGVGMAKYTRRVAGVVGGMQFRMMLPALHRVKNFGLGLILISIAALINTQLDRVLISRWLSAENLSIYVVCGTLAGGLTLLTSPICTVVRSQIATHVASRHFHLTYQVLYRSLSIAYAIVLPIGAMFVVMPENVVFVWTGNRDVASASSHALPYMAAAGVLLSLVTMFHLVALADGFTKLHNAIGIATIFVTIPGYIYIVAEGNISSISMFAALIQIFSVSVFVCLFWRRYFSIRLAVLPLITFAACAGISVSFAYLVSGYVAPYEQGRLVTGLILCVTCMVLSGLCAGVCRWFDTKRQCRRVGHDGV